MRGSTMGGAWWARRIFERVGARGGARSTSSSAAGGSSGDWKKYASAAFFALPIGYTFHLGNWQRERYTWKVQEIEDRRQSLAATPSPPPSSGDWSSLGVRRVAAKGSFDIPNAMFLGPRPPPKQTSGGGISPASRTTGYNVIVPFKCEGGAGTVLVNCGWAPQEFCSSMTEADLGKGVVSVTLVPCEGEKAGSMALENVPSKGQWYSFDVARMSESVGLPPSTAACDLIQVDPGPNSSLPLKKKVEDLVKWYVMPETHLAYCVTWYGLSAAMTAGTYLRFFR